MTTGLIEFVLVRRLSKSLAYSSLVVSSGPGTEALEIDESFPEETRERAARARNLSLNLSFQSSDFVYSITFGRPILTHDSRAFDLLLLFPTYPLMKE